MRGEKIQNDLTKRAVRALAQIAVGLRAAPTSPGGTSGGVSARSWLHAEEARKFVFNALVVVLLVLFIAVVGKATFKRGIIVEPISVPKELVDRGYTAEVVAQQIIEEINAVVSEAETSRELGSVSTLPSDRFIPKVELPGSGISIAAIIYYMRDFFGLYDLKIVGEVTHERNNDGSLPASPKYLLRVRIAEPFFHYRSPEASGDLAQLIKAAAMPILEPINPYIAGISYLNKKEFAKATRMAQLCLRSGSEADRQWGLVLRGAIARDQKRLDEAHIEYSNALQKNPDFPLPHYNIGNVAFVKEQYARAFEVSLYALSIDDNRRRRAIGYHNAGVALEQMWRRNIKFESNPALSILLNQLFGRHHPISLQDGELHFMNRILDSPQFGDVPGATVLSLRDGEVPHPGAALSLLRQAIESDPMYYYSYLSMARIEYDRRGGDRKSAELLLEMTAALFTERTAISHKSAVHHYLGRIRADRGDYSPAFKQFRAAVDVDPNNVWPYIRWGQALLKQASQAQQSKQTPALRIEAVAKFEQAIALKPADSSVLRTAAETFEQFGMVSNAIDTYKKIIALGGDDAKIAQEKTRWLQPPPVDSQHTGAAAKKVEATSKQ